MTNARRVLAAALLCTGLVRAGGTAPPDRASDELTELVERLVARDDWPSEQAEQQIVEMVIGPLARALGPLDARPADQQVRIRRLLSRLAAELRVRLVRASLHGEDARLFDEFQRRFPELVRRLFADDYRVRMAALQQIPLEPATGAGVLIAAKVDDPDADVAEAALELAAQMKDPAVVRGLTRYVRDATLALREGMYGAADEEIALTLALFVSRSIEILGQARARESVPEIVEALRVLGREPYQSTFNVPGVVTALGQIGDERAAPALLGLLEDATILRAARDSAERPVRQTLGDLALVNLLSIFRLQPEAFGVIVLPDCPGGFSDDASRAAACRDFRAWYDRRRGAQAGDRTPPTTRPADAESRP